MSQMSQRLFDGDVPLTPDKNTGGRSGTVSIALANYGTLEFTISALFNAGTKNDLIVLAMKCSSAMSDDLESVMRRLQVTIDLSTKYISFPDPRSTLLYHGAGNFLCPPIPQPGTLTLSPDWYYKAKLCMELLPPNHGATSITSLSGLSIGHRLFPQIEVAPADYTTEPGARFVLRSNEGGRFYVHTKIIDEFSPVLKAWIQENRAGLCDGVPLKMDCSTAALSALLTLMYKQEVVHSFGIVLHDILEMCDIWRITAGLDVCAQFVRNNYKETQADFDVLLSWFVSVSMHLVDGELEATIFKQLICLAGEDKEKKDRIKDQLIDYQNSKSPEESAELLMKIGEAWASKK